MSQGALQDLVDALSAVLERPVLLDDAGLRPIAFSRQWGAIDQVRRESILNRAAAPAVRRALLAEGIAAARGTVRTRAVPTLGMEERLCVPARDAGGLRGYLWFFEQDGTIDADGLRRAKAAARTAAGLLARREQSRTWLRDDGALLAALLSPDETERAGAVSAVSEDRLPAGSPLAAATVAARDEGIDAAAMLARLGAALSPGHALAGTVDGEPEATVMVVVALADPALSAVHPVEVSGHLLRVVGRGRKSPGFAVGQSAPFIGLDTLRAARRQAEIALRVARSRAPGATHAAWDALGADRLVAQMPAHAWDAVPGRLARLVSDEPTLRETLDAYLDAAGNVQATARVLSLHRSGVYYRLRRIEVLTGLDLACGADRLTAHLALRLERLASDGLP
jgi:hypothetical protein